METILILGVGAVIYLGVMVGMGAYVAEQKRRPLIEGMVFGVCFGPLGLLVVASLPEGVAEVAEVRRNSLTEDVDDPLALERWLKRA